VCHVHAFKWFKRFIVGCDDLIMIQELGGCQLLKIRKQKQLQNVMNWWLETIK